MALPVNVRITRDTLSPSLQAAAARYSTARLGAVAGRAISGEVRKYLFSINPGRANKLGGRRTNFYQRAGQSTSFEVGATGSSVFISLLGFRQRYYGGKITAAPGKALSIPVAPEAYGKRPREFNDLEVIQWMKDGKLVAGLARRSSTQIRLTTDRKTGQKRYKAAGQRGGEILYIFKKSVMQEGDTTILPEMDQLATAGRNAISEFVSDNQEASP